MHSFGEEYNRENELDRTRHERCCQIAESTSRAMKRVDSAGLSAASDLAVQERNMELEQRLAKFEFKAAAAGTKSERPSRPPSGLSSASIAIQKRNRQLENQQVRLENRQAGLENLTIHEYKVSISENLNVPTIRSEGSVHKVGSHQMLLMDENSDERIRQLELRKMLQQAQELDLAFLVDATGSMMASIDEVKKLAPKIANDVKKAFPKLKLRVAFVPYRDYAEHDQDEAEKCDFTDSFEGPGSILAVAIAKVRAEGGGEPPEDVFSGLERVATLSWSSKSRILIHIGDAPCNGKEFHDYRGFEDAYHCGDAKGRDISKLLGTLRHDCQIVYYLFCHINDRTKKMLKVFREKAPQGRWIQEEKLDKISNLLEVVVSASCKSIAVSTRVVGEGPSVPKYVPVAWKNEKPQWSNINWQQAVQFSYMLPPTLENLFKIVDHNGSLLLEQTPASKVKIARRPFTDEGNVRWPYHAQAHCKSLWKPPRKMVVKRFKDLVGEDVRKVHTIEAYCEQMEMQTVAAFMAEHFNHELKKLSGLLDYKTVQFSAVSVLQVGDSTYYNMEEWLQGTWIRYSNNVNYVNTKEYAATLHAFSHWTYQRSDGLLMVTDLQGVQVGGSNGRKKTVFMLCDPAVHCKHVYRYSRTKTNWSTAGMDSFFETHQCNDICRSLNLKPKSSSFTKS